MGRYLSIRLRLKCGSQYHLIECFPTRTERQRNFFAGICSKAKTILLNNQERENFEAEDSPGSDEDEAEVFYAK